MKSFFQVALISGVLSMPVFAFAQTPSAQTDSAPLTRTEVRADLVIGCDGRNSTIRQLAKLEVKDVGVPIDVLWMHISKSDRDPEQLFGFFGRGKGLGLIDRGDYLQVAFVMDIGPNPGLSQPVLQSLGFRRLVKCRNRDHTP